ncbi:MAG: M14 family zinc carboxypeptidase [Candidatus Neomarinimicrobiota bacterium]|nr:M14 family zinc carboxypeptidase [Candidatus Neomarinimicrobiota bacterium]
MKYLPVIWTGLILSFQLVYCNEIYQSVRIFNPSPATIQLLAETGIPLDHITGKAGVYLDIVVSESQVEKFDSIGVEHKILIHDLTQYMQARNVPAVSRDFPLGSMQGNYTWDELNSRFDELRELYGAIISERHILGQSTEGRDIWAFKVSDNPAEDEQDPEVLYTALTHAREPVSMMNLFYFVQMIGENYGSDPELTYLVDNREMWFLPVINPDGYVYNESIQPNGGGMHRKNRRDTFCGNGTNRGIDLNRNYGYGWGANDTGSSPDPCEETYRGESAFSEPETQAVRDFIENRPLMNVLHYHTFSNVYIHPYGNASLPDEPDLATYREIGAEMARLNGYAVGTGYETIGYTVNGDAVDWTYGAQGLVTFTPEVGSYDDYFWPSEDRIVPLCKDQLHPNMVFSFVAGNDIVLQDVQFPVEEFLSGETVTAELHIQNRGLMDSDGNISITLEPVNSFISLDTDSIRIDELEARDDDVAALDYTISADASRGAETGFITTVYDGSSYPRQDTIQFFIGAPDVIILDSFEMDLGNWQLEGDWGLTDVSYSGNWALSDSPDGNYGNNQSTAAALNINFDLSYYHGIRISYMTRWEIEPYDDFVQFQAYIPNEGWISLAGEYTVMGSGQDAQPPGDPGYHGNSDGWVKELIELNQLGDSYPTSFRFIQTSDNYNNGDGFSVDDFTITAYPSMLQGDLNSDNILGIMDVIQMADMILFNAEPTPYQIFISDLDGNGTLDLFDIFLLVNLIMEF